MMDASDGGTFVAGVRGSYEDTLFGMSGNATKRGFALVGLDSANKRVWGLASDTLNPKATAMAWASGRRMWIGGWIGIRTFDAAFELRRGWLWPNALLMPYQQNFLALTAPMPSLSPLVANKPRLAGGNAVPLQLYPNPARSITTLTGPARAQGQVLDLQGRRLESFKLDENGSASLNLQSLKPGLYLIHCQQQTVKLVVE
jgi:hypothetical protein